MIHTYIHTYINMEYMLRAGRVRASEQERDILSKGYFWEISIGTHVVFRMRDVNVWVEYLGRLSVGVDDE